MNNQNNRQSGLQRIDSQPSGSYITSNRNLSNRGSEAQPNTFNNPNTLNNQGSFNHPNNIGQNDGGNYQPRSTKQSFNNIPPSSQYGNSILPNYQQQQDTYFQRVQQGDPNQTGYSQKPLSTRNSQYGQQQNQQQNNASYNQNQPQATHEANLEQQFEESQTNILQHGAQNALGMQTEEYIFPQTALISFLRKLYALLLIQTIIILLGVWIAYLVPKVINFIADFEWIAWASLGSLILITTLCFVFRIQCSKSPINVIALLLQSLCLIILYIYILDLYQVELAFLILIALCSIYLSLLVYVLTTKTELNFRGSTLFVTCSAVMIYQLFLIFTKLSYISSIFILMGIVIWGYFLVYEYQTKVSDVEFENRDPIISTVTVFLDVFNLLLKVSELIRQILIKERS